MILYFTEFFIFLAKKCTVLLSFQKFLINYFLFFLLHLSQNTIALILIWTITMFFLVKEYIKLVKELGALKFYALRLILRCERADFITKRIYLRILMIFFSNALNILTWINAQWIFFFATIGTWNIERRIIKISVRLKRKARWAEPACFPVSY